MLRRRGIAGNEFRRCIVEAPDGIALVSPDHRFVYVNDALCELLGRPREQIVGHTTYELSHPDDVVAGCEDSREAYLQGLPSSFRKRFLRPDGTVVWIRCRARELVGGFAGDDVVLAMFADVTAERAAVDALAREVVTDALTGLSNRTGVLQRLETAMAVDGHNWPGGAVVAAVLMDIDGFKLLNDSLGHAAGDDLLRAVGQRLQGSLRSTDIVGRLGGDEFLAVLSGPSRADVLAAAARYIAALAEPIHLPGRSIEVTGSVGIAFATSEASARDLCAEADAAMYEAKRRGRGHVLVFDATTREHMQRSLLVERELPAALDAGRLRLAYQPIRHCDDGRLAGIEALSRWHDERLGDVAPVEFVAAAEHIGLMAQFDRWMLDAAASTAAELRHRLGDNAPWVSVNASPRQFVDPAWSATLSQVVDRYGLAGTGALCVEITEDARIDLSRAAAVLTRIRQLGVRVALDDFGAGRASLQLLSRLPLDIVKLDDSLVREAGERGPFAAVLSGVVQVARTIGLQVVAEGVETDAQLEVAQRAGCAFAQGWLTGRPVESGALWDEIGRVSSRCEPDRPARPA